VSSLLQPLSAEFQADPYPTYHRLRDQDPVHCASLLGFRFWVLTRYRDVAAMLKDPRLSAQAASGGLMPRALSDGKLFFKDPPEHSRLRGLINRAFLPPTIEALRPQVQAQVDKVLDEALVRERAQGHFDVVRDLGAALSLGTVLQIMGLPEKDAGRIRRWTESLSVLLDATQLLPGLQAAHRAAAEIIAYLKDAIEERRRDPRPLVEAERPRDLLCGLIAARDFTDQLSGEELIATAVFTLMAAHETVTSVVGSGLLALLSRPAQWARLRADPSLVASAFEEMLRFDPPAQITTKTAKEDLEIDGRRIRKGQVVVAVLAAANRDPEQFPDPDRFDIGRRDSRHLAFSLGPHYCVGAALARLEGQLLLAALLRRMPELGIDAEQAVRKPGIVLRGLRALPARSQARGRALQAEAAPHDAGGLA
jgi:hypothetical protein